MADCEKRLRGQLAWVKRRVSSGQPCSSFFYYTASTESGCLEGDLMKLRPVAKASLGRFCKHWFLPCLPESGGLGIDQVLVR